METLTFEYRGGRPLNTGPALSPPPSVLVGVVGSGNLEVLVEAAPLGGLCRIEIQTAAVGFGATWRAVMDDVFARHPLADVRISINDVGATPAVVGLRLDQALDAFAGGAQP
ncbi:malonate decarboxylase acyl carrier protein (plasmid) [Azospirillum sp. B510]|uniref:malonate decarboxylase acyl carrier protein n=1 Tax=Azospirillum sp. (strain B510) TaxID=137722 RepID=UPI0001C4C5D2|nr:malonate decarboxylase acyl carrier protein [Azospirillum sp. B510]BAI74978.1 malonate decarboxylase acyl carrier protein [Azospirillum sp. B510]